MLLHGYTPSSKEESGRFKYYFNQKSLSKWGFVVWIMTTKKERE